MSYAAYRDPARVRGGLSAPYDVALVNGSYATVQDGRVVSVTVDGVVHDLRGRMAANDRLREAMIKFRQALTEFQQAARL